MAKFAMSVKAMKVAPSTFKQTYRIRIRLTRLQFAWTSDHCHLRADEQAHRNASQRRDAKAADKIRSGSHQDSAGSHRRTSLARYDAQEANSTAIVADLEIDGPISRYRPGRHNREIARPVESKVKVSP